MSNKLNSYLAKFKADKSCHFAVFTKQQLTERIIPDMPEEIAENFELRKLTNEQEELILEAFKTFENKINKIIKS